jgi:hypothetical protein
MALYGIYGSHTTESCPLNNTQVLKVAQDIDNIATKNKIKIQINIIHRWNIHSFGL